MRKMIAMAAVFLAALSLPTTILGQAQAQSQLTRPVVVSSQNDYQIAPQDVLKIDVFNEEELSNLERRVSATGEISFPLLNSIHVAGKSPAEVEKQIAAALDKDYIISPTVSVTIKNYTTRRAAVLGQATKPGAIELPAEGRLTILEAIALAGGPTKLASGKIEFTRKNGEQQSLELDKLKTENDPRKVIYVQEGDVITLKESRF